MWKHVNIQIYADNATIFTLKDTKIVSLILKNLLNYVSQSPFTCLKHIKTICMIEKKTELYVASYVHKLCCKSRELNIWIFTVVIKECSTYPTFKAHLKQWLATRSVTTIAPFPLVTTLVNLPRLTTSQLGLDRLFSVTIEYHLMCVAVVIATSQSIP